MVETIIDAWGIDVSPSDMIAPATTLSLGGIICLTILVSIVLYALLIHRRG